MASRDDLKPCPFCPEQIPQSARFCPYCRAELPDFADAPPPPPPPRHEAVEKRRPRRPPPRYEDDDDYDDDDYDDRRPARRGEYARCPHCGLPGFADKVGFTWWGGVVGPALLSHVRCRRCRKCYNGKTGSDNVTGIVIYTVGGVFLGILVLLVIFLINLR